MRNLYQCKVCSETFTLLRYLRKHLPIPEVGGRQPNKCQSYYSGTGNLQKNLKVKNKIVAGNTTNKEFPCNTKSQRVKLISTNNEENTSYSEDDDCRIIEDEPACLKFEPDEEDELYYFDRDNSILQNNGIVNNSPQIFGSNEDKTKEDNHESKNIEEKEQDKEAIKQGICKRSKNQTREIGSEVLHEITTEINSSAETTICKKCKLACTSLENLCIHYETLHKLPVVILDRVIANQRLSVYKLTESSNIEEAIKPAKTLKCNICSRTFTSLKYLKHHKSCIHNGKIFNCNVCHKTFNWLGDLKRHKLSVHDRFRYMCNICGKQFSRLASLNRHKSSIHDNVRFKCDTCQKEFNQLDNLKTHTLHHHEQIMYRCNDCPKQFHSAQGLNYHQASIHNGVLYTCELCEKQFRCRISLKEHKASMHEGVRYKCDTCSKEYSFASSLRKHKSVTHDVH